MNVFTFFYFLWHTRRKCIIFVIVTVLWVAKFLPLFSDYFSFHEYTQKYTKYQVFFSLKVIYTLTDISLASLRHWVSAYRVSLTSSLSAIYIVIHASKIFAPFFRILFFVSSYDTKLRRGCGTCQFHGSLRRSSINQWRYFV